MPFTTHAADRAAERFGLSPSEEDWTQTVLDIIDTVDGARQAALLLRTFSDGIERWLVKLCGRQVVAVYDPSQAVIITVQFESRSIDNYDRRGQAKACAQRPVERRSRGRWRFTSDEHIA